MVKPGNKNFHILKWKTQPLFFFLRYDTPKYLSLTTSIRQSTNQDLGNQYNTLRIAPEWHLTKNLTLKDSFTSYMNLPKIKML